MDIQNKRVVVAGGTSGIGSRVACAWWRSYRRWWTRRSPERVHTGGFTRVAGVCVAVFDD